MADRALYYFGPGGTLPGGSPNAVLHLVILLLPINLLLLYWVKDRSLFTPAGLFLFGLISLQPIAAYMLIERHSKYLLYLNHRIPSLPYLEIQSLPHMVVSFFSRYSLFSSSVP